MRKRQEAEQEGVKVKRKRTGSGRRTSEGRSTLEGLEMKPDWDGLDVSRGGTEEIWGGGRGGKWEGGGGGAGDGGEVRVEEWGVGRGKRRRSKRRRCRRRRRRIREEISGWSEAGHEVSEREREVDAEEWILFLCLLDSSLHEPHLSLHFSKHGLFFHTQTHNMTYYFFGPLLSLKRFWVEIKRKKLKTK